MKKKVKLADVLWDAANEYLRSSNHDYGKSHYTCDCVSGALIKAAQRRYETERAKVMRFLQRLGLPKNAYDRLDLFDSFSDLEQRQGARYIWLLLAIHAAEDEGIEIEVQS